MSDPTYEGDTKASTRRSFFKGVGAGALGLSMLRGPDLLAANDPDLFEEERGGVCPQLILATDRQADNLGPIQRLDCLPCPCPENGQDNWTIINRFVTSFTLVEPFCDELQKIPVSPEATMSWRLDPQCLRVNGPCQSPIGTLDGRFSVRDIGSDGTPILLFTGRVYGTMGFETCIPPGGSGFCCVYPRVEGMLIGRGRPGTPAQDCITRWNFCGEGPTNPASPCELMEWHVRIAGVVKCPCD